jgi:hypothetical protein
MELIQFKSINGHKFPKLRFIWAAINPDDDELSYDVEKIDPATLDRFVIPVEVPYKPNAEWFRQKYGQKIADSAILWWEELTEDEKKKVSPRRLQYALDVYVEKGDMRDVLPISSNVSKLVTSLNTGPITDKLDALLRARNDDETRKFLSNENNFAAAIKYIPKAATLLEYFAPLMPKEKLASLMDTDEKIGTYIVQNLDKVPVFHQITKEVVNANLNAKLVKKIRRALTENENLAKAFAKGAQDPVSQPAAPHFNKVRANATPWSTQLVSLAKKPVATTQQRLAVYDEIVEKIPADLSSAEAGSTLQLLNYLFCDLSLLTDSDERNAWQFPSMLNQLPHFMGIVNHCLHQIHKETGKKLPEIVSTTAKNEACKFEDLLKKIVHAGLRHKLPNDDFGDD